MRSLLLVFTLVAAGCSFLRPARDPMEARTLRQRDPASARGAIVLLPGFGDDVDAFRDHGFADALAHEAPDYDVYAADAHFGYYRTHSLLPRLEHDVIAPLRARGYRELWLAGTSLGGFGAVAYARTHPERVRGVLLFAPYMGPDDVLAEVRKHGLCKYAGQVGHEDNEENFARANFLWLREKACDERDVSLWIATGTQDRLLTSSRLLSHALPAAHTLELPGGHGWAVWTPAVSRLAKLAFDTPNAPH